MSVLGDLFDTPIERTEFVRAILIGIVSALVTVYIVKKSKVI